MLHSNTCSKTSWRDGFSLFGVSILEGSCGLKKFLSSKTNFLGEYIKTSEASANICKKKVALGF